MNIDISKLSVAELDQQIARAAKKREEFDSPMGDAQPAPRIILLTHMLQHALLPKIENTNAPIVPAPSGGDGRLH